MGVSSAEVAYDVRAGRPVIRVFPWGDRKRKLLEQEGKPYYNVYHFEPYFYIPADLQPPAGAVRVENGFTALDGPALNKVVVTVPAEVPILRKSYEPNAYEADVLFPQRYIIDRVPELPHSEPDILYVDIEMAAARGLPDPLNPVDPIIAISTYNSAFKTFRTFGFHPRKASIFESRGNRVEVYQSEKELLGAFAAYVRSTYPDVWVGWNLINFDVRCILGRMSHCNLRPGLLSPLDATWITRDQGEPIIKGVVLFDLLAAYKAFKNRDFDSLSLEATAQRELGVGKRPVDKARIAAIWSQDPAEIFTYCRTDVELIVRLDRKLRLLEYWNELHEETGVQLGDLINWKNKKLHGGHIVETYVMRNSDYVLRSHSHVPSGRILLGADPMEPRRGLHKNIVNLDVSSLYPSIISTFNLSPDALEFGEEERKEAIHLDLCWTCSHREHLGELPRLIGELFAKKDEYHKLRNAQKPGSDEYNLYDRRRYVYKQILNAFQGASSQPSSRIFNGDIAHDITWAGRAMMDIAERRVAELGYDLIGGHTDSVFFAVPDMPLEKQVAVGAHVARELSAAYKAWAVKECKVDPLNVSLVSELAGVASTGFFHAKTQYALKMAWKGDEVTGKPDDEVVVAGFQSQRSDYPLELRDLMDTFLKAILDGANPDDAAAPIMVRLREISRGEVLPSRVAIPKGLGRAIGTYRNHSPWDKGCQWSNKHLETVRFAAGSKPKLLYVRKVPKGMDETHVVCIESDGDLVPGIEVDWPLMSSKMRDSFRGIISALGLSPKTFLTDQTPLEAWM